MSKINYANKINKPPCNVPCWFPAIVKLPFFPQDKIDPIVQYVLEQIFNLEWNKSPVIGQRNVGVIFQITDRLLYRTLEIGNKQFFNFWWFFPDFVGKRSGEMGWGGWCEFDFKEILKTKVFNFLLIINNYFIIFV